MGKAGKKDEISVFILFILKLIKIKNLNEIEKYRNRTLFNTFANVQLSKNNCPKLLSKVNLLSQVVNANKDDLRNLKSIIDFQADFNFNNKVDLFNLATNADQDQLRQKKKKN